MSMESGRQTEADTGDAALLLKGTRFVRLGRSRVGRMLGTLLIDQGADPVDLSHEKAGGVAAAQAVPGIDIVIDDQTSHAASADEVDRWRAMNPRVIYVRFSDFPRSHPRWAPRSTLLDEMIHAELGLNRIDGAAPAAEPLAMASAYGAIWSAVYVGAALMRRDLSGLGDYIEFPLFSAGITVMARKLLTLSDPTLVDPLTVPHLPLAEIYECADGRYVQSQGHSGQFVEALLTVAGRMEWRDAAATGLHLLPDRKTEALWLQRLTAAFLQRPAAEWEREINAIGGACTVCRSRDEWLATTHANAAQIVSRERTSQQESSPVGPGIRVFLPAASASDHGSHARPAAQPASATAKPPTAAASLPLAGVRVVDFAIILAGPTCGRTLSELGADVIKVDAGVRPTSMFGWLDVNRGKRSIAIDLKRPAGRDIARRLIAGADVVIENFRAGKLAGLGLGFDDAVRLRPNIVYASLNAFDFGGEWAGRAGWEHNAQAATGMQLARANKGVPKMVPVPVNDYSTGLLGAFGVLLALRRARETGRAVRVAGSLARSATFIQTDEFAALGGSELRLPTPVTRVLPCADGWVRVVVENPIIEAKLEGLLSRLAQSQVESALTNLRSLDIPAVRERTVADLLADPSIDAAGLRVSWQHPHWGPMRQIAAIPEVSGVSCRRGWPAPDPGEDGAAILAELGFTGAEIEVLTKSGVVSGRVPLFPPPKT